MNLPSGQRFQGRLCDVLTDLGGHLPPAHLSAWIAELRAMAGPSPDVAQRLAQARPGAGLATRAASLSQAWNAEVPSLSGAALALALEAAALQYERCHPDRHVEIVVSGPTSSSVPVRLTSSVATDVIRDAREALLVVSFAAHGVADVVEELRHAAHRGVHIDLVLEDTTAAPKAFDSLVGLVQAWEWPRDQHTHFSGGVGSLHAKVIAADRGTTLLGSANLTDRALADNLEIGVILRDSCAVGQIVDHFQSLMRPEHGPLRPI